MTPEDLCARVLEVERIVARQNRWRLRSSLNLIASENVLSRRARALMTSDFQHRYAEGHPGRRYYNGTKLIDEIEARAVEAFRALFRCRHAEVRLVSGTVANDAVFRALVPPGATVFVNGLPAGGHISHQAMGALGKYAGRLEPLPLAPDGMSVDVPRARDAILRERPAAVLLGRSLILFPEPVRELAEVCRETGAALLYDGAHVLGLIAGGAFQDPLAEGADVLVGSTHKTFFGPQRGVILSNMDDVRWKALDRAAFPGAVSNHHLHTLPPLLVSAYEMMAFGAEYARQVVRNARALAAALDRRGVPVCMRERGFTATHQIVVDARPFGGGERAARRLEAQDIIANKNLIPGDPSAKPHHPSGIRFGVQELTRWGMREAEMEEVAQLVAAALGGRKVRRAVHTLRRRFTEVCYSFDGAARRLPVRP
jgi:glycine hydroxymethyltransferase